MVPQRLRRFLRTGASIHGASKPIGRRVNLEVDVLAKYTARLLSFPQLGTVEVTA